MSEREHPPLLTHAKPVEVLTRRRKSGLQEELLDGVSWLQVAQWQNAQRELAYRRINQCFSSLGSQRLQVLQEQWSACAGKWKESSFYLQMQQRDSTRKHGARLWLTRAQLAKKYESQSVADEICDAKLAADEETRKLQVKPHPDAPTNEEVGCQSKIPQPRLNELLACPASLTCLLPDIAASL